MLQGYDDKFRSMARNAGREAFKRGQSGVPPLTMPDEFAKAWLLGYLDEAEKYFKPKEMEP